jgi:signal transduction histidine kinase
MIVIRNISVIVEFEQVKSENKYQELLTATMSHEMLTPLNSIINLAVYLEEKIKAKL